MSATRSLLVALAVFIVSTATAQFKRNELRDALLNTATRKMQIREGELLKKDIQRVGKFNSESKAPTRAPGIIDDFEENDNMPLYQMPDDFFHVDCIIRKRALIQWQQRFPQRMRDVHLMQSFSLLTEAHSPAKK